MNYFQYSRVETGKYKWQLDRDYIHELNFLVVNRISNDWVDLLPRRLLVLARNYQSDGVTGFFDLHCLMRAAFVHDGLLQLVKLGLLPREHRADIDREFYLTALADRTPKWLAWTLYKFVRAYALIFKN